MATAAQYVNLPFANPVAALSAANTNRDGTGTLATIVTAGRAGARVERLRIQATGTTTAGMIRLYRSADGGTTNRLIQEQAVTAVTPSGTVPAFAVDVLFGLGGLILGPGELLRASTHNAESFTVSVPEGGDF